MLSGRRMLTDSWEDVRDQPFPKLETEFPLAGPVQDILASETTHKMVPPLPNGRKGE